MSLRFLPRDSGRGPDSNQIIIMNGQINFLSVSRTITGEANSYIKLAVEIHGTITVIHVKLQHTGRSFIVICRRVPLSSIINRPLK